jgi:nucleotide-binding universal stress UspA family protein
MKKILLLLPNTGFSQKTVETAFQLAKEQKAELISCYVVDERLPESVASWMIYIGFMGDKPSEEYREVILKEYRKRAEADIEEVKRMASGEGIEIRSFLKEGDWAEETVKLAKEEGVGLIVTSKPKEGQMGKLFFGSALEELMKIAPCDVRVVEGQ